MEAVSNKVLRYETFLNETLKGDLEKVLRERDKLYSELSEYLQLKTVINNLQEEKIEASSLKTKVDIGCNFYVQANIEDTSMIYVCVGFGFYVQLTLAEALTFIEKKVVQLTKQTDSLSADAAKIKAHVKLVLEGLQEMQQISNTEQNDVIPF